MEIANITSWSVAFAIMVMWFWKHYVLKGGWGLGSFKKTLHSCNILFPSNPWYQNVREYGHGLLSRSLWTILIWNILTVIFPECVARVPVSLWGSGGMGVCSLDVAEPSQPSATVRNRSRDGRMAVPMVSFAEGSLLEVSHAALLGFAWQAWHFVTFRRVLYNVSRFVLCGMRNTLATFSEDALQFSWQTQHFGRVHRHFAWQAQHLRRVVLLFFGELHCQGCVKWRQGAHSMAGVAFCEMW